MRRAALDKVDPHRARRLRSKLLQLQTLLAELQGELRIIELQRQIQAFSPLFSARLKGFAQGLNVNAGRRRLLNHGKHTQKY
jgi:hypothetical protein